ncbi:MAG: hypothetical protein GY772_00565, partial [bacterium]|nr:hypothetical protein [bacterium]
MAAAGSGEAWTTRGRERLYAPPTRHARVGGSRSRSARGAANDDAEVGDAATPETPYFRCRVGLGCLNYGGLRSSPAYNNMMLASLEDSPALLLGAQELHEFQEMAMQHAGWASSGIYRGLCVLARRPVATEVQVVHDYGMVDVPNEV